MSMILHCTSMALSKLLPKSAFRAASTATSSSSVTKAAGDISSVFPSLRPDYKPEPLPARFQDLKRKLFERNASALERSWKRLLTSLEGEVDEIRAKGSSVCDHFREGPGLYLSARLRSFHLSTIPMSSPATFPRPLWLRSVTGGVWLFAKSCLETRPSTGRHGSKIMLPPTENG